MRAPPRRAVCLAAPLLDLGQQPWSADGTAYVSAFARLAARNVAARTSNPARENLS